jgi:hypothetical protein
MADGPAAAGTRDPATTERANPARPHGDEALRLVVLPRPRPGWLLLTAAWIELARLCQVMAARRAAEMRENVHTSGPLQKLTRAV